MFSGLGDLVVPLHKVVTREKIQYGKKEVPFRPGDSVVAAKNRHRGVRTHQTWGGPQSTHRVAIADFCRTSHHDGKISPGWWAGGALPLPIQPTTIMCKVAVSLLLRGRCTPSISSLPYIYSALGTILSGYDQGGNGRKYQLPLENGTQLQNLRIMC